MFGVPALAGLFPSRAGPPKGGTPNLNRLGHRVLLVEQGVNPGQRLFLTANIIDRFANAKRFAELEPEQRFFQRVGLIL